MPTEQDALAGYVTGEPAFGRRGYMLDVSRDRVPTLETIAWLIDVLAALRFTEFQLYVEHTFTYTGHDVVWRDASPLSHRDMAWIADYAGERGVQLVAHMNGFGHMGRWLRHDGYRQRAECPEGTANLFGGGPAEPSCLEPTPENAAFAVDLAREMLSAVGGRRIHIGGDEPFELGEGRSAERVAEVGRDAVYLEHLVRMIEPLVADGVDVMFWADQFRNDPALVRSIPDGATGVVWHYEAPSGNSWLDALPRDLLDRLNLPADSHLGFEAHARLFIESETPFWVAPGTGSWNSVIGRNVNAAANIADAAAVGARCGAEGLLLADWGDNGHWQPLAVSLPSMVRAAAAAWNGRGSDIPVGPVVDGLLGARAGTGDLLDRLGGLGESLGLTSPNGSPIFTAILDTGVPTFGEAEGGAIDAALVAVAEAAEAFSTRSSGPIPGDRGGVIAAEMTAACGLAGLGLRRIRGEEPGGEDVEAVRRMQAEAWLLSSRPGGLADSLGRLVSA
ncbi:MAG: family 20 glycosylhydrolase [Actinobacteria bacterium]|nr:family 20 glycosylhydrolase [Actinomycetota bacterium]